MKFLFIHQNFPGQYQHVVRHLADQPENQVVFITQATPNIMKGVGLAIYATPEVTVEGIHPFIRDLDKGIRNGIGVADTCRVLEGQGFRPDIVIGHNGWGEIFFVKDVWPDVPLLGYFEFFYRLDGSDVGFDPEYPSMWPDGPRLRTMNAGNLLGLEATDWGQTPTRWQWSQYPAERRNRISILHEGVDTNIAKPDPEAWIQFGTPPIRLTRRDEVVTYVSRNLEPYRGFHVFMRALPEILRRRPKAHVLVIGGDEVSYGRPPAAGATYREMLLREVGDAIDLERVHFVGKVPHSIFINVLQVSSVHIYLTFPFVLSWSFMEAMSAGCLVVASATPPVTEVMNHGENGLLVDFHDQMGLADRVDAVLDHPDQMQDVRDRARRTIVEGYDLRTVTLPRYLRLIEDVRTGAVHAAGYNLLGDAQT